MKTPFLLLALSCSVAPLAAQTVYLPSPEKTETAAVREKAAQEAAKSAALANKADAINEGGTNGFDIVTFDSRRRMVQGTPFLLMNWVMGDVVFGTSNKPLPGVLKFDVYSQELRSLRPQGDSIIIAPEKVQVFTLRPTGKDGVPVARKFERLPDSLVPESKVAFAEELSKGTNLRLLKYYHKSIVKSAASSAYGSSVPLDSYHSSIQYYLRWADGACVPVKDTKSSIISALALRNQSLAADLQKDKAKVRTDDQMAAWIEQIDARLASK